MSMINYSELDLKEESVIRINRVAKVNSRGKRFSFSTLVVIGDGKAHVGIDPRHIQPVEQRQKIRVVQRIENNETGINRHLCATKISIHRIAVTAETCIAFEQMNISGRI